MMNRKAHISNIGSLLQENTGAIFIKSFKKRNNAAKPYYTKL